jgi:hypothetical protein
LFIPEYVADEKIVLDRFHIEGDLNKAVDHVRKEEHKALKEQGIELLTHTNWDWLYHPENLPEKRAVRSHHSFRRSISIVGDSISIHYNPGRTSFKKCREIISRGIFLFSSIFCDDQLLLNVSLKTTRVMRS